MPKETTFFSYSRSDSNFVLKLAKDLRSAGADLWLDQLDIKAGSRWDSSIEEALGSASRLIVILSPASVASNNVMDEVSYALESNKTVIPVLLSECKAPFRIKRLQHIDFMGDYQTALDQLLEVLGYNAGSNRKEVIQNQQPESAPVVINEVTQVAEKKNIGEAESKLWEEAKRINSISSYKKYLNESITGLYKEQAQQLINKLADEQRDEDLESLFWEKSRAKNTPIAFRQYIDNYPDGKYKSDALNAIDKIEETEKKKAVETVQPENFSAQPATKKTGSKKYIFATVGIVILALGIWGIINMLSGKPKGKTNDSVVNVQKSGDTTSNVKTDPLNKPATENYPTVKIANQVWMLKDLNVSNYRNGDPIPEVRDQTEWSKLTTGAWCWYNNDSATYGATYGKLYNWYAVNDPRGLAPKGWHVPSKDEMMALILSIDPAAVAGSYGEYENVGGTLKEQGISHWKSPNTAATNSSGFTALPNGLRDEGYGFDYIGRFGSFWSSSELETQKDFATYMQMARNQSWVHIGNPKKSDGYAVRCIKEIVLTK